MARARDRFPSADPVARRSLSPDEAGHKFAAKVGAHAENPNGVVRGGGGAESAKYDWFFLCCTLKISGQYHPFVDSTFPTIPCG